MPHTVGQAAVAVVAKQVQDADAGRLADLGPSTLIIGNRLLPAQHTVKMRRA